MYANVVLFRGGVGERADKGNEVAGLGAGEGIAVGKGGKGGVRFKGLGEDAESSKEGLCRKENGEEGRED